MINIVRPGIWTIIALAVLLAVPIWGAAPSDAAGAIEWHDYEEGMNLSAAQNKSVLIDFSTDWCSWCKKMDAETYTDARVIGKARHFVCIKVDGDLRGDLVSSYGVKAYPTTVFVAPNGTVARSIDGFKGPDDFLNEMDLALGGAGIPAGTNYNWLFGLVPLLAIPVVLIAWRISTDGRGRKSKPRRQNGRRHH
jgi:thiol-disulfide isomerase/thioredoxin